MHKLKLLLLVALNAGALQSFGQADSLTVIFSVTGPKREKYTVYHAGKQILSAPRGGFYFDSFRIARPQGRQNLNIYITRAKLFGLFQQSVGPSLGDSPKYRYLVYARDPYRKNRYPLVYYWTNEKPRKPWVCDYRRWRFR
jgi:hypothetical protein